MFHFSVHNAKLFYSVITEMPNKLCLRALQYFVTACTVVQAVVNATSQSNGKGHDSRHLEKSKIGHISGIV